MNILPTVTDKYNSNVDILKQGKCMQKTVISSSNIFM
jgi:hypothetical protein